MSIKPTNLTNEITAPVVTVDFSHRLSHTEYDPLNAAMLANSVDNAASSATAVLSLLQGQFLDDDTVIFFAIQSVIENINDITQMVEAHRKAVVANQLA